MTSSVIVTRSDQRRFHAAEVPPAVADELQDLASALPPIAVDTIPAVRVQAPTNSTLVARFRSTLDPGESEALALAIEVGAKIILIDETLGRAAAERVGIQPVGALGVLVRGKQMGLVNDRASVDEPLAGRVGVFHVVRVVRHSEAPRG
jgi:hypothetical protein